MLTEQKSYFSMFASMFYMFRSMLDMFDSMLYLLGSVGATSLGSARLIFTGQCPSHTGQRVHGVSVDPLQVVF